MSIALQPRKHGVAREIVRPAFEGTGDFNSFFLGLIHDRRAGIWSKNVCPEFSTGEPAADIHDEIDCQPAVAVIFTWIREDDVERWAYIGLQATLCRKINGVK